MMKRRKTSAFEVITCIILILFVALLVFLLAWGILTSLKTEDDAMYYPMGLPTEGWQFSNYGYLIKHFYIEVQDGVGNPIKATFGSILLNTIVYAGLGSLVAAFVPLITAYLCARFTQYKLSSVIYTVVVVVMMLPIVGTYPAQLKLLKVLNVYDTYWGMIMQKMSFTGTYFLVYFAMVKGLDKSYAEAAYIDGAGEFTVLFKVYFPLLINTFFTVMLLLFVAYWNDYNTPLLYMPGHPTMSYAIYKLSTSTELEFSTVPMRMCAGVVMVIPIMTLFIIFRDKITGNLTMGGVKG